MVGICERENRAWVAQPRENRNCAIQFVSDIMVSRTALLYPSLWSCYKLVKNGVAVEVTSTSANQFDASDLEL